MMRKVRVDDGGDSSLIPGMHVEKNEFMRINAQLERRIAEGEEVTLATSNPVLLGITKASLVTESFMSAAAFQETTRFLPRRRHQGQGGPVDGAKRKCHHRKTDPRRHRYG
jgi:DNA-directed RNA polymerase subunit beta'